MILVRSIVGFDPAFLLNLCLMIAACFTFFHFTREFMYGIARSRFVITAEIDGFDLVYAFMMKWMTLHQVKTTSKKVRASAMP